MLCFPRYFGLFTCLLALASTPELQAKGTPAGTVIANQVRLNFSTGASGALSVQSNTVQITVHEIIDVLVQSLSPGGVPTGSPDVAAALSFSVTNTGNGPESFRLDRPVLSNAGDFTPTPSTVGAIFIENGLQPGFQVSGPNADARYVTGTNDLSLLPDASQIVYVVSDMAANLAQGSQGRAALRAISLTPGAAGAPPGTTLVGFGPSSTHSIVGAGSATSENLSAHVITGLRVVMNKTQTAVRAPNGGKDFVPGAEADYQIEVLVTGPSGQLDDFVIDDPLPTVLRYVANSLRLNGQSKTDATDSDEASVNNDRIQVRLGRLFPNNRFLITYTTKLQ